MGPPPPFVENHPNIWIIQLDLYFARAKISDETLRFQTAASLLPPHHVMEFIDMIRQPPANAYSKLCEALQARLGTTTEEKLRSLLESQELGDQRPTQLLRHMQEITSPYLKEGDSPLVRQIFLKAMPPAVAPFLQFLPADSSLETLAGTADRVISAIPRANAAINAVQQSANGCDCPQALRNKEELSGIKQQLNDIQRMLSRMSHRDRSSSRARPAQRQQSTQRRNSPAAPKTSENQPANSDRKLCWYHHKFGENARSCVKPCAYNLN